MTRSVGIIIFPGFQLLDVAGPIAAFEIAERLRPDSYSVAVVAPGAGPVDSSSGHSLFAGPLEAEPFDTVVVSGGQVDQSMDALSAIVGWLRSSRARRIASVCSGAYPLAEAGLLDGRRATTHWRNGEDFSRTWRSR